MRAIIATILASLTLTSSYAATQSPQLPTNFQKEKSALMTGGDKEQQEAMIHLMKVGKEAVPVLIEVVEKTKDRMRLARASNALEKILEVPANQDIATLEALERISATNDDLNLKFSALSIMRFKSEPRAREILKQMVSRANSPEVRANILSAYVFNTEKNKAESPFLEYFLNDKSEFVQVSAAGLLGLLGNKKGLDAVTKVLSRPLAANDPIGLHLKAVVAAGQIGDQRSLSRLKGMESAEQHRAFRSEIRDAINEIEYANAQARSEKDRLLIDGLKDRRRAKWATNKLRARVAEGDGEAEKILGAVARDGKHPEMKRTSRDPSTRSVDSPNAPTPIR